MYTFIIDQVKNIQSIYSISIKMSFLKLNSLYVAKFINLTVQYYFVLI
jgi:hypothetical protein